MTNFPELTDEMERIGETLMGRWGPINDNEDDTGDKRDTIEAMCLLFPDASDHQLAGIVSMAHGQCYEDEVSDVRDTS